MTRQLVIRWALGLLLLGTLGCGDTFNEGGAKSFGNRGLKILDTKEGNGEPIKSGDVIEVHYRGWIKDSERKFDDSFESNRPLVFVLGQGELIEGFQSGIEGMKLNGERRIFIPSALGYGAAGSGRDIPGNADLVFQVTLIKVERGQDVKTTDLKEGTGPAVKKGDKVSVHYTGMLTDGTKFDSSLDRLEPLNLTVGAGMVIKGWDIGLIGMKAGGKRKLEIPAHLAYGKQGRPPKIGPNAPLVFDIDLLSIQ